MARTIGSAASYVRFAFGSVLSIGASSEPFTLSWWVKPINLTQTNKWIWSASASAADYFAIRMEYTADSVDFLAGGYTGTNPATSSTILLDANDVTNGCWLGYRYNGAGAEWSKWKAGSKTVINAAITFALPASDDVFVGNNTVAGATNGLGCDIAEVAIWSVALADADMADLARGVAADQFAAGALQFYAPLRGSFGSVREREYTGKRTVTYSFSGTSQGNHPAIIAKPVQQQYRPAWVLDLYHADGTLKAASRDLVDEVDYDVLGDFYPGDIKSPNIEVSEELSDGGFGIWTPGTVSVRVKPGPDYRALVLEDSPAGYWRLGESSGTNANDETSNNNDGTYTGAGYTLATRGAITNDPNTSVRFPGSSTNYVTVPHHSSLSLTAAVTVEAWVKPRASHQGGIFEKTITGVVNKQYLLFFDMNTSQGFQFRCVKSTTQYTVSSGSTSVPTYGVWYHVVGRYDGAQVRLWVNGREVGTPVALTGSLDSGTGVSLMGLLGSTAFPLDGEIDEVAVYPTALSEDRIRLHYQVGLQSYKGRFGVGREWRGVHALLRRYDALSHEVTEELSGVVVDADFTGVTFTLGSEDSSVLNTPVPRQVVNATDFPSATDLGAAIPVPMGSPAVLTPPYIGRDDNGGTELVGRDFAVGWQYDADAALRSISVEKVWEDMESSPGLELLTEWNAGTGSPAYASATTFTVTGNQSHIYAAGVMLRYKDTAGGSTWQYTSVASYAAGTVTVRNTGLDAGLNNVQLASDYLVEQSRYSMLSQNLLTIRRFDGDQGHPVVLVNVPSFTNPADVVKEILRNSKWGLAQTVDSTTFTTAATAFTNASLSTAACGALGWNRQQRRARDTIRDFLAMYGGRLWKDAATQTWKIKIDAAPTAATLTLGFGDGTYNNVVRVRSIRRRSLSDAVSTLRFHFGVLGRTATADGGAPGSIGLVATDFKYAITATALGTVGQSIDVSNPYVQNVVAARRIAYYMAQSLKYSDLGIELDAGMEARLLRPGDLVRFVCPIYGIDATFRVWSMQRRLTDVGLLLRGYDAAVYTYDSSKITVDSVDTDSRDEVATEATTGTNLLMNPDFSAGFNLQAVGAGQIPGWEAASSGVDLTSLAITADPDTISNASYLTAVVAASTSTYSPYLFSETISAFRVGDQVIASVYCDRADGWRFVFFWQNSGGSGVGTTAMQEPPLRVAVGANAKGWARYYAISQAPATSKYLDLYVAMDRGTGTFKFDGFQLETIQSRSHRPSRWTRTPKWGVDPAQLQPGTLTIRPSGQPEAGLKIVNVIEDVSTFGTGTTKDSSAALFPAGCMPIFLAGRVTTSVAGSLASIAVGLVADTQRFAPNGTSKTAGATWNVSNHNGTHVPFQVYAANTAVRISAIGGNFSGAGVVRLHACYAVSVAPTN